MSDFLWTFGALCVLVFVNAWMAHEYAMAYKPLRWPYKWMGFGLLFWGYRRTDWEQP